MAAKSDWKSLRAEIAVNEDLVAAYGQVSETERLLYALLQKRGLVDPELDAAFEAMQQAGAAAERDVETYLSIVAAEVAALGGRLEVRAVFEDQTVTLLGPDQMTE